MESVPTPQKCVTTLFETFLDTSDTTSHHSEHAVDWGIEDVLLVNLDGEI